MLESQYRALFDQAEPSEALTVRTLSAMERHRSRRTLPLRRVLLVAVLVLALITAAASASWVFDRPVKETISDWTATQNTVPVGLSHTDGNWTITVDYAFGDDWYCYLLCTLTRADGGSIPDVRCGFSEIDYALEGASSRSIRWLSGEDASSKSFYLKLSATPGETLGSTCTVTLRDLCVEAPLELLDRLAHGGGSWTFTFPLDYPMSGKTFSIRQPLSLPTGQAVLEAVRWSPLEVYITSSGRGDAFQGDIDRLEYLADMRLLLADGSSFAPERGGGNDQEWYSSFSLITYGPIAPEDVVGVQIGDTTYPLTLSSPAS